MACNIYFPSKTILGSLLAIGIAGDALGQGGGNIVGGGSATLTGGGDNAQITYSLGGAGGSSASPVQAGRSVTFAGTDGDGPRWSYGAPPDGNPGREAWMIGGGDNAEVVYVSPTQRR